MAEGALDPDAIDRFELPVRDAAAIEAEGFAVSLDGYEGPLDVLLDLARRQKVDLRRISVLMLVEQYLAFVAEMRAQRIELAADYLVMAAWLAYLKSRLLLPPPEAGDEPSADDLAARLAWQLERLEAMRKAAASLMAQDQLGRDRFGRGMPEHVTEETEIRWTASQFDLLQAYARLRTREAYRPLTIELPPVMRLDDALMWLENTVGESVDWTVLTSFLPEGWRLAPEKRRSALAAAFAAALELARRGTVELRQEEAFGPILLRKPADERQEAAA
ncbi:MAG: ScpA family protein [Pseudomonadota bacterium]